MQSPDFSGTSFPSSVSITDQEIDISSLTEAQKKFYIDLFREIVLLYQSGVKPRLIVGIAGPAGSGKSVIAAIFQEFAKQISLPFRFETLGIDAFHYSNEFLLAHTANGEPLKNHKGRFDTYDVEKLVETLRCFSNGDGVSLPVYSRKIHDPIENAVVIKEQEPTLLLLEGLWILYDGSGWNKVGELLDFSIFVDAENEMVRQGVLERHVRGGRTSEDAVRYYEENEAKNFNLVMLTKSRANKIIPSYYKLK